jgi:lipopolysaccharide export system protein LptC
VERRAVITMSLLLAGAAGSWLLLNRSSEKARPAIDDGARLGVGYYATDVRLSGTDGDGHVRYLVNALTVVQAPGDGDVALRQVVIDYDSADRAPWNLRADTGTIPPGGKMIRLAGNVVAETRATSSNAVTIRTEHLEFDTDTSTAATDREVTIDYAGSSIRGMGMRAELATNQVQLLSDVNGTYVP